MTGTAQQGEHGAARILHAELHARADRYGCVEDPCPYAVDAAALASALEQGGIGAAAPPAGRANYLPLSKEYLLNEACKPVSDALGANPMLVGSCLTGPGYRDVDVRTILPDEEFDALFGGRPELWSLLCVTVSEYLARASGLPVDFQVQRMSDAARHPGTRSALAMPILYAGGPTA